MSLIGKVAPSFVAPVVHGDNQIDEAFDLANHIKGKYAVLFFYPLDFTFVCPSELIAFDHRYQDFKAKGVEVVGCSIDSHFTHLAWKNTPVNQGGIGKVQYPLIADLKHEYAKAYEVESEGGVAFRGSFLIDKAGIIRHMVVNDLPLGRDIDEMMRMVDALQFTEENGEVCPAGWNKGKPGMVANPEGVAAYLAKNSDTL